MSDERNTPPVSNAPGKGEDPLSPLSLIERDTRALMTQLSRARFALRESETEQVESRRKLLLDLIDVLDAFERVFRNVGAKEDQITPQMKVWIGNFQTVRKLLDKPLSENGVARIENLDQGFDPHWHRASEVKSDPSKPDGTIIDEVKAGYLWHGHVLRKAEVIVVGPGQEAKQEPRGGL
jgi:molecular chaperone GrpE